MLYLIDWKFKLKMKNDKNDKNECMERLAEE